MIGALVVVAEPLVSAGLVSAAASAAHIGDLFLLVAGRGGGFPPLQVVVDTAPVPFALSMLAN